MGKGQRARRKEAFAWNEAKRERLLKKFLEERRARWVARAEAKIADRWNSFLAALEVLVPEKVESWWTVTKKDITKGYRREALLRHPDKSGSEELFNELTAFVDSVKEGLDRFPKLYGWDKCDSKRGIPRNDGGHLSSAGSVSGAEEVAGPVFALQDALVVCVEDYESASPRESEATEPPMEFRLQKRVRKLCEGKNKKELRLDKTSPLVFSASGSLDKKGQRHAHDVDNRKDQTTPEETVGFVVCLQNFSFVILLKFVSCFL